MSTEKSKREKGYLLEIKLNFVITRIQHNMQFHAWQRTESKSVMVSCMELHGIAWNCMETS